MQGQDNVHESNGRRQLRKTLGYLQKERTLLWEFLQNVSVFETLAVKSSALWQSTHQDRAQTQDELLALNSDY